MTLSPEPDPYLATSLNGRVMLDLDACRMEEARLEFQLNFVEPQVPEMDEEGEDDPFYEQVWLRAA